LISRTKDSIPTNRVREYAKRDRNLRNKQTADSHINIIVNYFTDTKIVYLTG